MENEALILDFLEWMETGPKAYPDVMSAWRTSCPRLTIWEDSVDASFVDVRNRSVTLTPRGRAFLELHRGQPK